MEIILGMIVAAYLLYSARGSSTVVSSISNALAFAREVYNDALKIQSDYGIDPRITLVQAAYESNFGLSQLSRQYKNLFGIKQSSNWKGGVVNLPTHEAQPDGSMVLVNQFFKVYPSYFESMNDWVDLLQRGYPLAYQAAKAGDFDLFFKGLANGKWGAYAGPSDGSYVLNTYSKQAMALLPSITGAIGSV
jgi:flagellum-specific peptidoglycan hydrolase FlgJ